VSRKTRRRRPIILEGFLEIHDAGRDDLVQIIRQGKPEDLGSALRRAAGYGIPPPSREGDPVLLGPVRVEVHFPK
jgi:hypothetical protein